MKILYLTDQTYLHGGIEKVLSQKANYLTETAGFEVIVCTYNQQGNMPVYPFSDKIRKVDFGVNYEIGKSYFSPANLRKIPQHQKALKQLLEKEKPDIIVSCSFGPDFYFLPWIVKQIPKIKEFHYSRFFSSKQALSFKGKLLHMLGAQAEKRYHGVVVLNEDEKQYYTASRITVIPNPVEPSCHRSDPAAKTILAAGRLSPVKNFGALIDAFAEVASDFPEWQLHLWGEDYLDTMKKLQQQIDNLGIAAQVKFPGVTGNLKKKMQDYSIYAMTSETECFPMVLLEALSVGLPVLTHNCPTGPRHIVTNGDDSLLTPYKDFHTFEQKLRYLMEHQQLRKDMGDKAVKNVQRFHVDKVMNQWIDLFRSLIDKQ